MCKLLCCTLFNKISLSITQKQKYSNDGCLHTFYQRVLPDHQFLLGDASKVFDFSPLLDSSAVHTSRLGLHAAVALLFCDEELPLRSQTPACGGGDAVQ